MPNMWTKRYLLKPTKEEYFKTKHPIAFLSFLTPIVLYCLILLLCGVGRHSEWILIGIMGCLSLGIGIGYTFAIKVKIYKRSPWPVISLLYGATLIVASFVLMY